MQRDLVERARRGDHDAFAVLARAAIGRLDAAARLILRDPDRAQDAVQETLVRCWRDLPTLRDVDRFDAWLNRLFLNACQDELRQRQKRRIEVTLPEILPSAVPDAQSVTADRDQIERGVRRLDPDHHGVAMFHRTMTAAEGLAYTEVLLPDMVEKLADQRFDRNAHVEAWNSFAHAIDEKDDAEAKRLSAELLQWNCAYQRALGLRECTSSVDETAAAAR